MKALQVLLAFGLVLPVAGCASAPARTSLPAASPLPAVPQQTGDIDEDGAVAAPSSTPAPAAVIAAEQYVRAWARPALDQRTWYAALRPLTTPGYASLLADTDPSNVPAHTVIGPARVVSSTTAIVVADVPTDAGPVRVTAAYREGRWLIATCSPAPPPSAGSRS
jgi:hypothetical protein